MDRPTLLRSRYYLKPYVDHMVAEGHSQNEIASILGCSRSTIRAALGYHEFQFPDNQFDSIFGPVTDEHLKESAELDCIQFLTARGWEASQARHGCVYDVFAIKESKTIKLQVKTTSVLSDKNFPKFKLYRTTTNTTSFKYTNYQTGDFDYWYFYHTNGDRWIIPFAEIRVNKQISMEGFDQYYIGRNEH